ncbi:MAG: lipopolysaccharide biosynthesis protein [Pseudomonadota bacterium]
MERLLQGWGKLVGGNAANGLLQLMIFAIASQALDLVSLGMLILIQAFARVIDGVFNFQSVNVLTHFLAEADQADDTNRFVALVKAGLVVDFGSAFLAMAVAMICLPVVGPLIGLENEWIWLGVAYCAVIATRVFGAIEASLRCFDRFGVIGARPVCASSVILSASLVAWTQGASAETFLWIWLLGEAIANLAFLAWSLMLLRSLGVRGLIRANARAAISKSRKFWPMMWQTNVTFGIRMLSQDGDVVVVGAVLGPAAASLLRAAKNLANIVGQLGRPFQQVVSAQLTRLVAEGRPQVAYRQSLSIGGVAGLAALAITLGGLLLGESVLNLLFGPGFNAAAPVLVALLLTASLFLFGVASLPLALALDRPDIVLRSTIWGTISYLIVLFALIESLALLGVGLAHIAFNSTWLLFNWLTLRKATHEVQLQDAKP